MNGIQYRVKLQEAKRLFGSGLIDIDALYAVADEYIAYIRAYKKSSKNKRLRIPSRGYLIRLV